MKIFFSAGEPSGDLHGANLIRELRQLDPEVKAVGYGGPEMASAGCQLHEELTALAVMGLVRVLLNLHKFLELASRADRYFRHQRPDAVVLIDYPGFNWWIASRAKAHGIPVFYYAPPQIWAWASWRVKKMKRYVDHVLCGLPFEARWFADKGCRATFVGHPFFDEVQRQEPDASFLETYRDESRPLVALLPGSRTQEVLHNLESILRTAKHVSAAVPQARFALACFKPQHADFARQKVAASGLDVDVFVKRTPELMHLADCCLAVSGSVSLELLYQVKPTVIVYSVGQIMYRLQAIARQVKFITLVNLLAVDDIFYSPIGLNRRTGEPVAARHEEPLFPEFVTCTDRSREMANHLIAWLVDGESRRRTVQRLEALKRQVAHGGACRRSAAYIVAELARSTKKPPLPHYVPARQLAVSPADRTAGTHTRREARRRAA
jgi:lipid-A-disaccharide synthase